MGQTGISARLEASRASIELVDQLVVDRYVLGDDYEILHGWAVHDLVVNGRSLAELWKQATERAVRVTVDDDVVTWDDFRTANTRTAVPELGPFRFDRQAYVAALAAE